MESSQKTVSRKAWLEWPDEIKKEYKFTFDETDPEVIHAKCTTCERFIDRIRSCYVGKLVNDVVTYGQSGTSWILKGNLERHLKSLGHIKCREMVTGMSETENQRSILDTFGSSKDRALKGIIPLLRIALHIARKEMSFNSYTDEIELDIDNGCKISSSYNNCEGCKALVHILGDQLRDDIREDVNQNTNFFSWMIDGSSVAKCKLTYERELMYVQTAAGLKPKVEQFDFMTMKPYVSVNYANLYHASLRSVINLMDQNIETSTDSPIHSLQELVQPLLNKLIGVCADSAVVNFGCNHSLFTRWTGQCNWLVKTHCYSHRMELAAHDALIQFYGHI